jgi:hypothetical protein
MYTTRTFSVPAAAVKSWGQCYDLKSCNGNTVYGKGRGGWVSKQGDPMSLRKISQKEAKPIVVKINT